MIITLNFDGLIDQEDRDLIWSFFNCAWAIRHWPPLYLPLLSSLTTALNIRLNVADNAFATLCSECDPARSL